ncbi:hypothetical protein B0H19DRAFT_1170183 [Mycena capillaripes]|nr:hypothetical protein B0H19DRAFT_1170183 [Mycena capillaripes]
MNPITTHVSHYPPRLALPARDQCLRNLDLLEQFLTFEARTFTDLTLTRRTLYSAALTSKNFSECAIKLLWRRLSNILPLLRLVPNFRLEGEVYILPGIVTEEEWAVVHRYAAYVWDIDFAQYGTWAQNGISVDPSVYVLLAMRGRPLFPNLRRLSLSTSEGYTAEMLLCLSSGIKSLTLADIPDIWAETFLHRLTSNGAHLSYLSLGNHAGPLSKCIAFQTLKALELHGTNGGMPITAAHLIELGSLPALQSFATDMSGWDRVELASVARQSLFQALTELKINADLGLMHRKVLEFLSSISSCQMQSLSIWSRMGQGWGARWEGNTSSTGIFSAIMRCIEARWTTTLQHLDILQISGLLDDLVPLQEVKGLQSVHLRSVLRGPLSDARVLSVIRTWINLRTLEISRAEADATFLRCLAEYCPALRTLRVAYTAAVPPTLDVTAQTTSHLLEELRFFPVNRVCWNHTRITRLAQYLDHFFPNLVTIRGEVGNMWWEEVEQLVFEHQENRRRNSQTMATTDDEKKKPKKPKRKKKKDL